MEILLLNFIYFAFHGLDSEHRNLVSVMCDSKHEILSLFSLSHSHFLSIYFPFFFFIRLFLSLS